MSFTDAIGTCLRKYATFQGRARRAEYWWFQLFLVLACFAVGFLDGLLFGVPTEGVGVLVSLFLLATFLPTLAVAVRRLHDTDRSGWWLLLGLIPLIGQILLIIWYATKGTRGKNRFGPDPLDPA
ncbi:MAG: DUF805 domain-containing protein [Rhodobacteraceae bacterium]|nr:DUF805 domain-containing protein [Paracoccaceae bacterium]